MQPRYGLALLALLAPGLARAADEVAPEQALPAGTQLYLRWDGLAAHKAAYAKSALGKTMAGDAGTFVNGVFRQLQDGVGTLLTAEKLLSGVDVALGIGSATGVCSSMR